MEPRIDYHKIEQFGAAKAMYGLEHFVRNCGLEHRLLELVKMRASQIKSMGALTASTCIRKTRARQVKPNSACMR